MVCSALTILTVKLCSTVHENNMDTPVCSALTILTVKLCSTVQDNNMDTPSPSNNQLRKSPRKNVRVMPGYLARKYDRKPSESRRIVKTVGAMAKMCTRESDGKEERKFINWKSTCDLLDDNSSNSEEGPIQIF